VTWVRRMALAVQFLTILPIPVRDVADADLAAMPGLFPAVGLALGLALWGLDRLLVFWDPLLRAAVLVAAYTAATGGLHLDGLMDTFDALGSRRPAVEALEVMKDSRLGAIGALAGFLALVLKVAAWASLALSHPLLAALVPGISRTVMLWAMAVEPPARPPAASLGARTALHVRPWWAGLWSLGLLAGATGIDPGWAAPVGVLLILALGVGFAHWMSRRFGGMTGDTYGAVNEMTEVVGWVLLAAWQ